MRIRLSLTLDVKRDRDEPEGEPMRESSTDALVERDYSRPDFPRIGFTSGMEDE